MSAIAVEGLSKTYDDGTRALQGVDLKIAKGDFFALLGANGAGKTTMIGIITGLVNKTEGRVKIFDIDIERDFSRAKKMIGVVPQEFNFNIFERVEDILVTQAGYFGIERKQAARNAEGILKKLGLWHKRRSIARMLSGGMKRRLMIARALIHNPQLLILDEPTAGVDVELRHEMWDYLRDLNQKGTTILLTTHYLEEVEQMCRHAAIIKNGEVIKNDRVSRLVQLLDKEVYAIVVKQLKSLDRIKKYNPVVTDEEANMFEIQISRSEILHDVILELTEVGMVVLDIRPQGHRLEKLFLDILKD